MKKELFEVIWVNLPVGSWQPILAGNSSGYDAQKGWKFEFWKNETGKS